MGRNSASLRPALVGILSALGCVLLWMACVAPSGRTGLTALAGLCPVTAVLWAGRGAGYLCWAVISLLGLILMPDKGMVLLFALFLGLYPVVKSNLEQLPARPVEWALKLIYFNVAFALCWFLFQSALGWRMPSWLTERVWLAFFGGNLIFLAYDLGLTRLIGLMVSRLSGGTRRT